MDIQDRKNQLKNAGPIPNRRPEFDSLRQPNENGGRSLSTRIRNATGQCIVTALFDLDDPLSSQERRPDYQAAG
jgi:hypothetical protein